MRLKEQQYIEDLLKENDIVVFACSGGPDSMCLLELLNNTKQKKNITLICAHINHKRRKESDEEYLFVKKYCLDKNIIFEGTEFLTYEKGNFESLAHQMRKEYFESIINKYHANYFMTAHHGDDLVETILMRLTRGSNFSGYLGFSKVEKHSNYQIVRPLITTTKEEIIAYNKKNNIPYVLDASNDTDDYTRNRYRHHLLPFLKKENKNIHLKFLNYQEKLCRINEFLVKITQNALTDCITNDNVHIVEFKALDPLIQQNVLEQFLYQIYQSDIKLINDKHVKSILDLINSSKSTGRISLPQKRIGIKEYECFKIINEMNEEAYQYELKECLKLPNDFIFTKISESQEKSNNVLRLNSEEIEFPLIVRTRKQGDFIASKNLNGHQKVKDIFINHKIPLVKRDMWPIVTDASGKVLWIPGLKKAKFDKEINEKYDIIYKCNLSKEKNYVTKK